MNDTPRTDAIVRRLIDNDQSPDQLEHFAKGLERELNAFVRLVLGDEATLTPSGNVVLAVAKLKGDLEDLARLRTGGCARDQKTTQFCAEAVELERKLEAWKAYAGMLEEAGNKMHWAFMHPFDVSHDACPVGWAKAKETKP